MKSKFYIREITTGRFLDWYGCEDGFEDNFLEVRNMKYDTREEAIKELSERIEYYELYLFEVVELFFYEGDDE